MADHGLDVIVCRAMLLHEFEIDQKTWAIFTGHGKSRDIAREFRVDDFQHRADGKGVFIDQFDQQIAEAGFRH
jgi:hypothetical protein